MPSYYSHASSSQSDPTAISARADTLEPEPFTDSVSPLRSMAEKNPYLNPYSVPPPPPPHSRTRFSIIVGIISGIVVSILILSSVGIFALLTQHRQKNATTPTVVPSERCGGVVSDEFNGTMNARWQWINPSGNATHEVVSQGRLHIAAPTNNDLYPASNYNAPRLLQPISGNFTVETSIEFNPNFFYQGAGILIWQDEGNFLRFERAYATNQGLSFMKVEKGTLSDISPLTYHLTAITRIELRIQRDGNYLTTFWRIPGQEWQPDGITVLHFDNAMVGLVLAAQYNQGPAQTTAYYDYFRVTCA